jgi:hypothetical protein
MALMVSSALNGRPLHWVTLQRCEHPDYIPLGARMTDDLELTYTEVLNIGYTLAFS